MALFGALFGASALGAAGNVWSAHVTARSDERIEKMRAQSNLTVAKIQSQADMENASLKNSAMQLSSQMSFKEYMMSLREAKENDLFRQNNLAVQTASQLVTNEQQSESNFEKRKLGGDVLDSIESGKPFKYDDKKVDNQIYQAHEMTRRANQSLVRSARVALSSNLHKEPSDYI